MGKMILYLFMFFFFFCFLEKVVQCYFSVSCIALIKTNFLNFTEGILFDSSALTLWFIKKIMPHYWKTTALQNASNAGKVWMSQSHHLMSKENSQSLYGFRGSSCLRNRWCWIWLTFCINPPSIYQLWWHIHNLQWWALYPLPWTPTVPVIPSSCLDTVVGWGRRPLAATLTKYWTKATKPMSLQWTHISL